MTRKKRTKLKNVENKKNEKTITDDKQMRSLASFGIFPLAYAIGFIPEMAYVKQILLFAVMMIVGSIALIRVVKGKALTVASAGLFILGSVLNIIFIGTSQIVVLLVLAIVFAVKMKKALEKES